MIHKGKGTKETAEINDWISTVITQKQWRVLELSKISNANLWDGHEVFFYSEQRTGELPLQQVDCKDHHARCHSECTKEHQWWYWGLYFGIVNEVKGVTSTSPDLSGIYSDGVKNCHIQRIGQQIPIEFMKLKIQFRPLGANISWITWVFIKVNSKIFCWRFVGNDLHT